MFFLFLLIIEIIIAFRVTASSRLFAIHGSRNGEEVVVIIVVVVYALSGRGRRGSSVNCWIGSRVGSLLSSWVSWVARVALGCLITAIAAATCSVPTSAGSSASTASLTDGRVDTVVLSLNLSRRGRASVQRLAAAHLAWPVALLGSIVPPQIVRVRGLGTLKVLALSVDAHVKDVTVFRTGYKGAISDALANRVLIWQDE